MVGPRGFQPLTPYSESVETRYECHEKKLRNWAVCFPNLKVTKKKQKKLPDLKVW